MGRSTYGFGSAAYTENGSQWSGAAVPAFESFDAAAYGDGQFILGSNYGTTASSMDGRNFRITNAEAGGLNSGTTFGNGRLVTTKYTGVTISSVNDGATWEISTQLGDAGQRRLSSPVFVDNQFYVSAYQEGTRGTVSVFSSADGLRWTKIREQPFTTDGNLFLTLTGGKLFAGNAELLEYTADGGQNWQPVNLPSSSKYSYSGISNVVFDGQFYWVTVSGQVPGTGRVATDFFSSPDLVNWTLVSKTNQFYLSLTAFQGGLVAISDGNAGGLLVQTVDGIRWTASPLPGGITHGLLSLVDSDLWICGEGQVFHSNNLRTWVSLKGPLDYAGPLKILESPNYLFGVGDSIFVRSVLHR